MSPSEIANGVKSTFHIRKLNVHADQTTRDPNSVAHALFAFRRWSWLTNGEPTTKLVT